jgi:hypothetical protein
LGGHHLCVIECFKLGQFKTQSYEWKFEVCKAALQLCEFLTLPREFPFFSTDGFDLPLHGSPAMNLRHVPSHENGAFVVLMVGRGDSIFAESSVSDSS